MKDKTDAATRVPWLLFQREREGYLPCVFAVIIQVSVVSALDGVRNKLGEMSTPVVLPIVDTDNDMTLSVGKFIQIGTESTAEA